MTELKYTLEEKDLLAFNEYQFKDLPSIQKGLRRNQTIIPGIISAVALFYFFYYQDLFSAAYIALVGVAWGLLVPIYIRRNMLTQIKKQYTDEDRERLLGDYTMTIKPKHLVEQSPGGDSTTPWSDVLRIEVTKNHAFIYLDADSALILPRKGVTSGNIAAFVNEMDERIDAVDLAED